MKRPRGHPTKFNQDRAERVVSTIRGGNYVETAAAAAGVSKQTVYSWIAKGRAHPESDFGAFAAQVDQAHAIAEAHMVAIISAAAQTDWCAAAWRLERMYPARWGRQARIDIALDLRREARRLALERGLPEAEVMAEAEAVLQEHGHGF